MNLRIFELQSKAMSLQSFSIRPKYLTAQEYVEFFTALPLPKLLPDPYFKGGLHNNDDDFFDKLKIGYEGRYVDYNQLYNNECTFYYRTHEERLYLATAPREMIITQIHRNLVGW